MPVNESISRDLKPISIDLQGQTFWLDPLCAAYWEEENTLLISDLHIGKSGHFRKNGWPVPEIVGKNNLWNLSVLLDRYSPAKLIFLGDLFHSHLNDEWKDFLEVLELYPDLECTLVTGNHDILDAELYTRANINITPELKSGPFNMVHDPVDAEEGEFNLAGHIHPCVVLRGKANQRLRLSCFWISKEMMVFPAFGDFTGNHRIRPKKDDRVYVVAGNKVRKV